MLAVASLPGGAIASTIAGMTYRVYLRWPFQRVTDKTVTESRAVADIAFKELIARPGLAEDGALGVALTEDGKQLVYHPLRTEPDAPKDSGAK